MSDEQLQKNRQDFYQTEMSKHFFIIDGYNFLHAARMIPRSVGPGTLQRSRRYLLRFLERRLTSRERTNTTVIFDVHQTKDEVPPTESFAQMTIINAVNYPDADTCIEELIAKHSAPKQLIVVSADHRLHRAARKRKSTPIDSEDFFEFLNSRLSSPDQNENGSDDKSHYVQGIEYPEEDLPEDIIFTPDPLTEMNDPDWWEKRIRELEEE